MILPPSLQFYPDWLPTAQADACFQTLRDATPWRQESVKVFQRWWPQPRLVAWYGDPLCAYTYAGLQQQPLPWTDCLATLRTQITDFLAAPFNSVLLNYYRNGQDSMGWHADNEPELGSQPLIASLSLGATRRFHLKHRRDKTQRCHIDLPHGSLLVMGGDTQTYWLHSLSKTKKAVGERINLTFRLILT